MKNSYLDLTLQEFLDTITSKKHIYYFDLLTNAKVSKINDEINTVENVVKLDCEIENIDGNKLRLTGTKGVVQI